MAIALVGAVDDARPGGLPPLVKLRASSPPRRSRWREVRVDNMTLPFVDPLELGDWGTRSRSSGWSR